jgi:hypothetical protein
MIRVQFGETFHLGSLEAVVFKSAGGHGSGKGKCAGAGSPPKKRLSKSTS